MTNSKAEKLIEQLTKLPQVGPRHATRIVLDLMNWKKQDITDLTSAINDMKDGVGFCKTCHNISEDEECHICMDPRRKKFQVCVVEKVTDLDSVEKTGVFSGLYHVLGGTINPLEKVLPKDLKIDSLISRLQRIPSDEVELIIATNPNTHGEATALYLEDKLKPFNIKTTRLGRGLSAGSSLEYADEITLQNAFKNRK